jgi:branched-chain amino acid transport system ATP-binding protein
VALITTSGLAAGYGKTVVVRNLNLVLEEGQVVALLGPNGAGKTTTLLTLAGVLPALGGSFEVLGGAVRGGKPHLLARKGFALVPE